MKHLFNTIIGARKNSTSNHVVISMQTMYRLLTQHKHSSKNKSSIARLSLLQKWYGKVLFNCSDLIEVSEQLNHMSPTVKNVTVTTDY